MWHWKCYKISRPGVRTDCKRKHLRCIPLGLAGLVCSACCWHTGKKTRHVYLPEINFTSWWSPSILRPFLLLFIYVYLLLIVAILPDRHGIGYFGMTEARTSFKTVVTFYHFRKRCLSCGRYDNNLACSEIIVLEMRSFICQSVSHRRACCCLFVFNCCYRTELLLFLAVILLLSQFFPHSSVCPTSYEWCITYVKVLPVMFPISVEITEDFVSYPSPTFVTLGEKSTDLGFITTLRNCSRLTTVVLRCKELHQFSLNPLAPSQPLIVGCKL